MDWSQPQSLCRVTEDAGFSMSDVAFVSGLDESTISRLWDDPQWLDKVRGRSLQALVSSVPGVAEYFASHSVLSRRNNLISELESEGLRINQESLRLSNRSEIPHQYLINALEAALGIMRGDSGRTTSLVARFWGIQQNRALEALYAAPSEDRALLKNPDELFSASLDMIPKLDRKGYSFHSIITKATFAHHLGIATGELDEGLRPSVTDRQSAFMTRSGMMGLLINSDDVELAQKYERMVSGTQILSIIEEWSFPTYARDNKPSIDFSMPGSILLRKTAIEILREIGIFGDAYLYYLCSTYLPLALARDPSFGFKIKDLHQALKTRLETCGNQATQKACLEIIKRIEEAS